MDCTQVLESDELDDSVAYPYKVKVAQLKVNDDYFPIYSGSNRIGRDPEFCSVVFDNMTLSKEHAVIEIADRYTHLIYDLGSKNRTKLGKMHLKPHVRYQLSDKSEIQFGDLIAEYSVFPEHLAEKPFGVIQESDDEIIPDTPMQTKSKSSTSSREESPTIFQIENDCPVGYDEPCIKLLEDQNEIGNNIEVGVYPQEKSKEDSPMDVAYTTVSASSASEEKVREVCEVTVLTNKVRDFTVNESSDGDETDPEDIFIEFTQKGDSFCESASSKTEHKDGEEDTVENGAPETTDRFTKNCKMKKEVAGITDVLVEAYRVNSEGEESLPKSKEEDSQKNIYDNARASAAEEKSEESREIVDDRIGDKHNTKLNEHIVLNSETDVHSRNKDNALFKVPSTIRNKPGEAQSVSGDGKEQKKENKKSTDPESEGSKGTTFNAATHISHLVHEDSESSNVPLTVEKRGEVLEGDGSRFHTKKGEKQNTNPASILEDKDDSIYDAATQVVFSKNQEKDSISFSTDRKIEQKDQAVIGSDEKKKTAEVQNIEVSDSVTYQEDTIFNAATQRFPLENKVPAETAKNSEQKELVDGGSVVKTTTKRQEVMGSDSETDDDDSFFNAATQVVPSRNQESKVPAVLKKSSEKMEQIVCGSDEKNITGEQDIIGSNSETDDEDSIFNAATQVIHPDNKLFKSSTTQVAVMRKNGTLGNVSVGKNMEERETKGNPRIGEFDTPLSDKDDSIFDAATQAIMSGKKEMNSANKVAINKSEQQGQIPETSNAKDKYKKKPQSPEPKCNDSIFNAPTQSFLPEKEDTISLKVPLIAKMTSSPDCQRRNQSSEDIDKFRKMTREKEEIVLSDSETSDEDDCSIMETKIIHSGSKDSSMKTKIIQSGSKDCPAPTTAKVKKSVMFLDISDDKERSITNDAAEQRSRECNIVTNNKNDSIFDAETQPIETSSFHRRGEDQSNSPVVVLTDDNRKQNSDQGETDDKSCDMFKANLSNSHQIISLDDSDDSIFTAPTQALPIRRNENILEAPQNDTGKKTKTSHDSSDVSVKISVVDCSQSDNTAQTSNISENVCRNDDKFNDSFHEAPTQPFLKTSEAINPCEEDDRENNSSLSRSSSYGSINEAPTQCMDELESVLSSKQDKQIQNESVSKSGPSSMIETERNEVEEVAKAGMSTPPNLKVSTASGINEPPILILPSSQELKKVAREFYGGSSSEEEAPSTSSKSPILHKRKRSCTQKPIRKRGIFITDDLSTINPRWATTSVAKNVELDKYSKKQSESVSSKKQLRISTKKTVPKNGVAEEVITDKQQELSKLKNIADQKERNGIDNSMNKTSKNELEKDGESGRPSRQRKLTWKARENRDDNHTPAQKGKKENKDVSEMSSGANTQVKNQIASMSSEVNDGKDNSSKKERAKRLTKINTASNTKDGNSETHKKNTPNSNKQKKSSIPSASLEDQDKKADVEIEYKSKRSLRVSKTINSSSELKTGDSETPALSISQRRAHSVSSSTLDNMKQCSTKRPNKQQKISDYVSVNLNEGSRRDHSPSVINSSRSNTDMKSEPPKKLRKTRNSLSPNSDQVNKEPEDISKEESDLPYLNAKSKTESKVRNRKKQNEDISANRASKHKMDINTSSEIQGKEKEETSRRGIPKRSVAVKESSVSNVESKSVLRVVKDKQERDSGVQCTAANSASSSDVESKSSRRRQGSATKRGDSDISSTHAAKDDKNDKDEDVQKRGRSRICKAISSSSSSDLAAKPVAREKRKQDNDICETPKKQRRTVTPSPLTSELSESTETNKRGRSKRSEPVSYSLGTKRDSKTKGNVIPEDNNPGYVTPPRTARQRNKVESASSEQGTDKVEDAKLQERSRRQKRDTKTLAALNEPVCGSPSYGSSSRKRKLLPQASSTESDGQSSQGEGTPKRSSRIKQQLVHRIMFTGVVCSDGDETTIKKLGGKIVQEPDECTILITDKIRRTLKFLCIMGQGKPIVSPDWIKKSHLSGLLLDPWNFIVKDKDTEKKFNFQLQQSLKEASNNKLLEGYSVFVTPSVKPSPSEMKAIVENSGGQFLTREPRNWPVKSFIISAVEDKKLCSKFKKVSVPIVSAEVLLTGILQQKLNVNDYILKW